LLNNKINFSKLNAAQNCIYCIVFAKAEKLNLKYIAITVYYCHSDETCAPIAHLPNSAQLEGTPTIPPTYILVRAVVWEYSKG